MKSRQLISGMAWTLALTCIALPLVVRTRFEAELRHNRKTLCAQAGRLRVLQSKAETTSTNSNSADALSAEELSELLRLRAQISLLREQTNLVEKFRRENARGNAGSQQEPQTPESQSQFAEELSADTIKSMESILRELPSACQRFAADHKGKAPSDFHELKNYLTRDGHRLTGVYTFEFVRGEGPKPGDALIVREASPRSKETNSLRVYGFADGRAVEMSFPISDEEGESQIRWERAQLGLTPPVFEKSH